MTRYATLTKAGNLQRVFTPSIVGDVLRHVQTVLDTGGRLRTVKARKGLSKLVHGIKMKMGKTGTKKDLYLWHPEMLVENGVFDGYIYIDDLETDPGVPRWQVYYRIVLLGKESDYEVTGDNWKGARKGTANEVTVNVRGNTIEVLVEMSGVAFLKLLNAQGKRITLGPPFRQQMTEKWGCLGHLYGNPGTPGVDKSNDTEGFQYVRRQNGQAMSHTGGQEGEWIGLNPADWNNRYTGKR